MASGYQGQRPSGSHRLPNSAQRRARNRQNEFFAKKDGMEGNWAYEAEQPSDRDPYIKRDNKRTNQPKVPKKEGNKNTPTMDEPLYELPDLVTLIPDQRYNNINLDYSGFLTLCEESYRNLTAQESRLTRQMTIGTYIHVMNEYFWVRMFKLAELFGVAIPFESERVCAMVNSKEALIPSEIHEYLKNIGQFKDGFGNIWRPNFPNILIPYNKRGPVPGGHFGIPDAENHNIYEIVLSPYTSSRRVEIEINGGAPPNAFYPLPQGIMPANLDATENFVGFVRNIPRAHPEAIARLQNVHFNEDMIGSRIRHSSELVNLVNSVLLTLESKVKISKGIPENIEGSTSIIPFVLTEDEDNLCVLRRGAINISSISQLTRSEIGQANLFTYRRIRTPDSPGPCFVTRAEAPNEPEPPPGWEETANSNFEALAPFEVTTGARDPLLNSRAFGTPGADNRPIVVLDWIRNNFKKKDR